MEIRPILSTLMRNKTGALLIALQIALTMAVVVNATVVILDRAATMAKPTGVDSERLIVTHVSTLGDEVNVRAASENDVRVLEALPGVERVSRVSTTPLSNSGSSQSFTTSPDEDAPTYSVAYYQGDIALAEVFGLEIVRGRWFRDDEIVYDPPTGQSASHAVLADALADEMFPDSDPIGQYIYTSTGDAIEIVGTYDQLSRPWYTWGDFYATTIFPMVELQYGYAVRVQPDRRDALVPEIEEALAGVDPDRVVSSTRTHIDVVKRTYQRDTAMNRMLTIVMFLVLTITALGIVGLASFSVTQRRRQIGTRRAIGAQKFHIVRYFLVENWLITTGGMVLGLALTFALNYQLITEYNLPRLDPVWLPAVVLGLWAVGLLAAMGPARAAAGIDPAIATRNV